MPIIAYILTHFSEFINTPITIGSFLTFYLCLIPALISNAKQAKKIKQLEGNIRHIEEFLKKI